MGGSNGTIQATDAASAVIGRINIVGRPTSAKTISSAGGKIHFATGTIVFANAGSSIRVSIQDVDATGPPIRPDLTADVFADLTGGGGGLTSNALNTITMTNGSKSIAHGDLIAVVIYFTARAGADVFRLASVSNSKNNNLPVFVERTSGAAAFSGATNGTFSPANIYIEFDDGTLATIDGAWVGATTFSNESFSDSTNPDERGLLFRLPFDAKVDALGMARFAGPNNANGDATLSLYETPLGTPNALHATNILGEQMTGTNLGFYILTLPSEITLTANADYMIALKAAGAGNMALSTWALFTTNHRPFLPLGSNLRKGTRNNGSGAFAEESPAVTMYPMGVRVSQIDTGGGGGIRLAGHGGLAA